MKLTRGERWLILLVFLSILHHVDQYLRIDHSGWPFLPRVSPFTYSLLVYPVFLSMFLTRSRPWYRVICAGLLFVFATGSPIFVDPLMDKFHTWAFGSNMPGHIGEENRLGFNSIELGIASIVLAVLLSVVVLMTFLSFLKAARSGPAGRQ